MTSKELYDARRALERLLTEVILTYSGFDKHGAAIDRCAGRMKAHARELNKPVVDAPRLTVAAE
jgi:hypothetical protein